MKKHLPEITVKEGDIVEFVSLQWHEPNWDFDYPSILIYPVIQLYTSGKHNEDVILDTLEYLTCVKPTLKSDDISVEEDFYGWDPHKLRRIANNRLNGKDDGKRQRFTVLKQVHEFFIDSEGYLDSKIINEFEY